MIETVAIYTEKTLRLYGITGHKDLAFLHCVFPSSGLQHFSKLQDLLQKTVKRFEHLSLTSLPGENGELRASLLLQREAVQECPLEHWTKEHPDVHLEVIAPVSCLLLHGPHFHNRYGIAETLLDTLKRSQIPLLYTCCSGTSMYLVLEPHYQKTCETVLRQNFLIPQDKAGRKRQPTQPPALPRKNT